MESFFCPEAVEPLIWCFKFGFRFICLPFIWLEEEYRVECLTERRYGIYIFLEVSQILRKVATSVYFFSMCQWGHDTTPDDVILAGFYVCIFITAAAAHSIFIITSGSLTLVINGMLFDVQMKALRNGQKGNGHGPKLLRVLFYSAALCLTLGYPGVVFAVYKEFPLFRFLKFPFIYVPVSLVWATGFVFDWAVVLTASFIIILYITLTITHILKASQIRCRHLDPWMKAGLHLFYRSRQVHHAAFEESLRSRSPFMIFGAICLIITSLFCVISLFSVLNPLVMGVQFCVCGFALTVLKFTTQFAASLRTCSGSYAKGSWPSGICNISRLDRAVLRSYRPLELRGGNFFKFGKLTFPIIIQEIVITVVVNGLVILRSWETAQPASKQ